MFGVMTAPQTGARRTFPRVVIAGVVVTTAVAMIVWLAQHFSGPELDWSVENHPAPTALEIITGKGNVRVERGPDGTAKVEREIRWFDGDEPKPVDTLNDGVLRLDGTCDGECQVDYVVTVPAATPVRVNSVDGDVTVEGMAAPVRLELAHGNAVLDGVSGELDVSLSSGNVTGDRISSTGARIHCDYGDVNVAYTSSPSTVDLSSSRGNIVLRLPSVAAGYQLNVTARYTEVDVPQQATSPYKVTVTTDSGNATVSGA